MQLDRFDVAVIAKHLRSAREVSSTVSRDHRPLPQAEDQTFARAASSQSLELHHSKHAASPIRSRIVRRLLEAVPGEWGRVSDVILHHVESIRKEPQSPEVERCRIAFVGVGHRAGCSTAAQGVAATLAGRGVPAVVRTLALTAGPSSWSDDDEASSNADAIEILDASGWFGAGPVRGSLVSRLRTACQAVILVRRATAAPPVAHARALEAAGVVVLGEVIGFVPACDLRTTDADASAADAASTTASAASPDGHR